MNKLMSRNGSVFLLTRLQSLEKKSRRAQAPQPQNISNLSF